MVSIQQNLTHIFVLKQSMFIQKHIAFFKEAYLNISCNLQEVCFGKNHSSLQVLSQTHTHTHTHWAIQKWNSSSVGQEWRLWGPDHIIISSRVIIKASNITAQIHQPWTPWKERTEEGCRWGFSGRGKRSEMRKERRRWRGKSKKWNTNKKQSRGGWGAERERERKNESRVLLKTEDAFTSLGWNGWKWYLANRRREAGGESKLWRL